MSMMHPKLAPFFQGREQFYPSNLEAKFSRIFNKILGMWGTPELDRYLGSLFVDDRGGRQGFPADVMNDILMLSRIHEHVRKMNEAGAGQRPDAWGDASVKHALQAEQIEYSKDGLFRAIDLGNERAVRLFIKAGIDLATTNASGWTPLIAAAGAKNLKALSLLLDAGADVRAHDAQGLTALHWAAYKGLPRVAELLLEKGADANAKSNMGLTPLSQAAMWGHAEVVGILLAHGANPEIADDEGLTALHKAVADGHVEVVKVLVAAGADREVKSVRGQTPASIARQRNNADVIAALGA